VDSAPIKAKKIFMKGNSSFGWIGQFIICITAGAAFTIITIYRSIENFGLFLPLKKPALAFFAASLLLFFLTYVRNRLDGRARWWPYAIWILILGLSGNIFIHTAGDTFRFLDPNIDKDNILPKGGLASRKRVKLSLNGDCRWANPLGDRDIALSQIYLPSHAHLAFGIGIIHGENSPPDVEISVTIQTQTQVSTEIARWRLPAKKHAWLDKTIDLSGRANGQAVITFRNHTPALSNNKEKGHIFITPVRVIVQDPSKPRPNLILVVVDSLRYDAVTHRSGEGHTPYLFERMRSTGIDFHRHFAQSSWTCPSMASLFTSKMPIQTGAVSSHLLYFPAFNSNFMQQAQDAGYLTVGFTSNGLIHGRFNYDQGMDSLRMLSGKVDSWWNSAESLNEEVLSWLQNNSHLPFVLYVHYMDPHIPYWPPLICSLGAARDYGWLNTLPHLRTVLSRPRRFKMGWPPESAGALRSFYNAEVRYWDKSFKEFMDRFEKENASRRTMIIVVSDHGEEFFDHGLFGHGTSLYQELIHVPMIIFPNSPQGHAETSAVTQNLDLMPTILDYLEIPIPPGLLGRSLLPIIKMDAELGAEPGVAYSELPVNKAHERLANKGYYRYMRARVQDGKKLIEKGPNQDVLSRREFYRLDSDPGENSPVTSAGSGELKEMIEQLNTYFEALPGKTDIPPPGTIPIDPEAEKVLRAMGYVK
jgi:arylsulfatase A-like enzyme